MENTRNIVAGFIPTREDFKGKFILGLAAFIGAVILVMVYHPAVLVAQLIEALVFFALIRRAFRWLGGRVVRFIEVIFALVAIGMLIAILLGNTPAISTPVMQVIAQ